jgi:acid phosphatase type 7
MRHYILAIILVFSSQAYAQVNDQQSDFLVKPYLQIGKTPSPQSLQVLWHAAVSNDVWLAEYKNSGANEWMKAVNQTSSKIAVAGIDPFTVYSVSFTGLMPGSKFMYRVSKNGKVVFNAEAKSLKSPEQSYRVAISGDLAAGTKQAGKIAYGIYRSDPDVFAIAGDIAYSQGLITDYKTKFWPVFNADNSDTTGVPLLRSIPTFAAVGNHDAEIRDLDRFPGALAYYHFWEQPLNGPEGKEGGPLVPPLKASDANRKAFLDGACNKYPRMTNFSFDYGNAHWTVIDSDVYVDWTDSTLRDWVIKDLEKGKDATWRFVLFHHPGFNSSRAHYEQQQMRLLAPLFEKGKVDLVFAGHVHNYQRSYPLYFVPDNLGNQLVSGADNRKRGKVVTGKWTLDKKFDGKKNTKPNGVIYIVTGAGGQGLYNPEQTKDKDSWQKFTVKFESRVHSFTLLDINGDALTLRQIDINGKEVDRIRMTK